MATYANAQEEYDALVAQAPGWTEEKKKSVLNNLNVKYKRLAAGDSVTSDSGDVGNLETASFKERLALGGNNVIGVQESYWDNSRKVQVHAPSGKMFELLEGGGVRVVNQQDAVEPSKQSSLFTQGTRGVANGGTEAVPGFVQEQPTYEPIAGKTIAEVGQSVFNPKTQVDEYANPGEVLIRYTDNTVERRPVGAAPGVATPIDQFGRTATELGIAPAKQVDNSGLEYIGREYTVSDKKSKDYGKKRVAGEGNAFYQDPETRQILERPDTGKDNALPSTSPSVLAARNDVAAMFKAVFGRTGTEAELRYWKGRTDKSGAALIGAMQFAKQGGKTIGDVKGEPGNGDPIAAMDAALNSSQEADFATISAATTKVDLSRSADLVSKLTEMLGTKPETPSLRDEYQKELLRSGYNEDAAALAEADKAIKQLDADFASQQKTEEGRQVSMAQVRRRQAAEQIDYERVRRDLVVDRDFLANKVANKQAVVNTMMTLFGQDVENAQAAYQNKFTNALAITNLLRGIEQDQLTQQQRQQDNARANVQVMSNLLSSGNVKYNQLDTATKSQLKSMELQAGLPVGFTQFVNETVKDPEVQFLPAYTDINGVRIQPIATINPKTGAYTIKNISQGKVDLPVGAKSGVKLTAAQKEGQAFLEDAQKYQEKMIAGDYNWQQAWDTLHVRYPAASVQTIDNALGLSFRNKYNK